MPDLQPGLSNFTLGSLNLFNFIVLKEVCSIQGKHCGVDFPVTIPYVLGFSSCILLRAGL